MQNIILIMDYSAGDLAFAEIKNQIRLKAGESVTFDEVPIESFNGRQAGFVLYQLASVPSDSLFFVNVAPRKGFKLDKDNKGEDLLYVELKNKNKILTTNSEYVLSYLKDDIVTINKLNVSDDKSQFRSRDFFSYVAGKFITSMNRHQVHFDKLKEFFICNDNLLNSDLACLKNEIGYEVNYKSDDLIKISIKALYVDSFGNIKTTIRKNHFDEIGFINLNNRKVTLEVDDIIINNISFNESLFSVNEGEYTIYFGSSGFNNPFLEIALRNGNAFRALGKNKFFTLIF